jgi:hypothetical protein
MTTSRPRPLGAIALIATVGVLMGGASAGAATFTGSGVGGVKLGKPFGSLYSAGLVGPLKPGCPLGINTRSAKLRLPLRGFVDFTPTTGNRRVIAISITRGATSRGIGVGSTASQLKAAFPKAVFDKSSESVFGFTLVKVSKAAGGKFQFAVSTTTKKVTTIGIPYIAVCD